MHGAIFCLEFCIIKEHTVIGSNKYLLQLHYPVLVLLLLAANIQIDDSHDAKLKASNQ